MSYFLYRHNPDEIMSSIAVIMQYRLCHDLSTFIAWLEIIYLGYLQKDEAVFMLHDRVL